jgi:hypothetical protein
METVDENMSYILKMQQTSDIGKIYQDASDMVFNSTKTESELIEYLASKIELFVNNEDKVAFIGFIKKQRIETEIEYPCLYKNIPTQHYSTLQKVKDWLFTRGLYYNNPKTNLLDVSITRDFTPEQQIELYKGLINNKFIPDSCDFNSFCYVFGDTIPKKDLTRLMWLSNKQLLRELLEMVMNPKIKKVDMEKAVPNFFTDEKGQPITLAKNKKIPSTDSDNLATLVEKIFFRKN